MGRGEEEQACQALREVRSSILKAGTHTLTSNEQIQEGHVGEDLEGNGSALEGG